MQKNIKQQNFTSLCMEPFHSGRTWCSCVGWFDWRSSSCYNGPPGSILPSPSGMLEWTTCWCARRLVFGWKNRMDVCAWTYVCDKCVSFGHKDNWELCTQKWNSVPHNCVKFGVPGITTILCCWKFWHDIIVYQWWIQDFQTEGCYMVIECIYRRSILHTGGGRGGGGWEGEEGASPPTWSMETSKNRFF